MRAIWTFLAVFSLLVFSVACGGGGGSTIPPPQQNGGDEATPPEEPGNPVFSVVLTANPDQGPAPLLVNFSAYAFGGASPYTYEWDFDGDGVYDSNMVNPYFRFSASGIVTLRVTDADGQVVTATRTITVTAAEQPFYGVSPLSVQYTVSATSGQAPLKVEFEAVVTGGSPPYKYAWDFEGDGVVDSFSQHVVYTYGSPGPNPDPVNHPGEYFYSPSLTVTDNRGVQMSTLDDRDGNGEADWLVKINVIPPSTLSPYVRANPPTGQAPLPVEFTGGASGGEPPYEFKWDFGDGELTDWMSDALISHVYPDAGTYLVRLTVRDAQSVTDTSGPVMVTVMNEPTFQVQIEADVTEGPIPLNVELTASTQGGKQPISYQWQVFTDLNPTGSEPMIVNPPSVPAPYLSGNAVVVPSVTDKPNPVITFGTYVGQQVSVNVMGTTGTVTIADPYVVRLVATDANGVQAVSNLIRVSPGPPAPSDLYVAFRYPKAGDSVFSPRSSSSFTARSNASTVTHPSGVIFLFGGEKVNSSGEFEGLVGQLDAAWALNLGADRGSDAWTILAGGWTQLNTLQAPPYPYTGTGAATVANPPLSFPSGIHFRAGRQIQRSERFINRGSAAATLIHEPWDGNPGGYGSVQGRDMAPGVPIPVAVELPDDPTADWGLGLSGLGVPVVYVFGGRNESGDAIDSVQKYYPPTFGTEDLYPVSEYFNYQIVNNMVDIWTSYFAFWDWDMRPQEGDTPFPPIVPDRTRGQDPAIPLNPLPEPLYGAAAVAVESTGNMIPPSWPEGTYSYIFLLGGINDEGQVLPTMRWLNTRMTPPERQEGQDPQPGDYSPVVDMPIERAYARAFVIPPNEAIDRPWQIVVMGGFDQNGNYISQVDRYTFTNTKNPVFGYWETVGTVPEAAAGLAGGWELNADRGIIYRPMSGRTVEGFTGSVFDMLAGGTVSYAPISLVPRGWVNPAHVTSPGLWGPGQADYYVIGGMTEQGATTIVEHYQP